MSPTSIYQRLDYQRKMSYLNKMSADASLDDGKEQDASWELLAHREDLSPIIDDATLHVHPAFLLKLHIFITMLELTELGCSKLLPDYRFKRCEHQHVPQDQSTRFRFLHT